MATPAVELIDEIASALSTDADLGSFTQAVTYTTYVSGGTDTTTAVANALFFDFDEREIDGDAVRRTDRQILFASKNLSLSPKSTDYIVDGSTRWEIVRWREVPGDAIWWFHLRKPGDGR